MILHLSFLFRCDCFKLQALVFTNPHKQNNIYNDYLLKTGDQMNLPPDNE